MEERRRNDPGTRTASSARDRAVQTDSRGHGQVPRLSNGNLFILLSLWMELFPQEQTENNVQDLTQEEPKDLHEEPKDVHREAQDLHRETQINAVGLVVVKDRRIIGLHSSGSELHAGQAAILEHGAKLSQSSLYFSRRPCATCLKMIINAGVSEICFWPGDPEVSMLRSSPAPGAAENHVSHDASAACVSEEAGLDVRVSEEAGLDALASDKLKSNSVAHICVPLKPVAPALQQFIHETSRDGDFVQKILLDQQGGDAEQLYNSGRLRWLSSLSSRFLVGSSVVHHDLLSEMNLQNFCVEPYFCGLRHNMEQLVQILSCVAAGVPHLNRYGFYRSSPDVSVCDPVSPDVAAHCMIQARLLSYRTEDPKVGVGAVIWAKRHSPSGSLSPLLFVGCGFNAYPSGSHFNEFPQMDDKQEDRQRRKYRFIIHAEQNALTFRSVDLSSLSLSLLFVTKCPCDECVPLIRAAGVSHIFTSDLDQDRDKGDISYKRFRLLRGVHKYCFQRNPAAAALAHNGFLGKHRIETEFHNCKKLCSGPSPDSSSSSSS